MTSSARPEEAIEFLRARALPTWHVRRAGGAPEALFPDRQGELILRAVLTAREAFTARHDWLPARHYGHDWPSVAPASAFPWAVVLAPADTDRRGPLPELGVALGGRVWWLHAIRQASHADAMERAQIIAAMTPLAVAWDPLAGVPLPGTGGAVVVGQAVAG